MLENSSSMTHKWKTSSATTPSKAIQTQATEVLTLTSKSSLLTSRTTPATTLPAALPATQSTPLPPPLPQFSSTSFTRYSLTSCLNFLVPKDTTSSSAPGVVVAKLPTKNYRAKDILTNSTPQYLLTTLRTAIETNVNYSKNSTNSNSINNNTDSSWINNNNNSKTDASRHMIQHNDKNDNYHMLSLNHQNCTNVLQHHKQLQQQQQQQQHQQQRNKPQRQCNNKHVQQEKHKAKRQFLLLLTCYVAIITIFSLPHLSIASSASASTQTTTHTTTTMSTTFETTNTTANSLAKATHDYPVLSLHSFATSSNDNVDDHDGADDNADELSPLAPTIENSISQSRRNVVNVISRFIRSLDGVSTSSSSSSSIFSPSSGGSGLTNIFNQNLDTGLANNIECPSFDENSACPCYKFEDGLFLECPGTTAISLRTTLERISSPIHSLSIYDFDRSVTSLSQDVFQPGVNIRHLQFSHSHLETLKDNSLKNVRASLESLSIVNGKLTQMLASIKNNIKEMFLQQASATNRFYKQLSYGNTQFNFETILNINIISWIFKARCDLIELNATRFQQQRS